jgi:hypothetical protein
VRHKCTNCELDREQTHSDLFSSNVRVAFCVYQDIIISVYAIHLLIIKFIFSDVIATCFGPLSGHHQAVLTQMYHETSFYNGSVVSIGTKKLLAVYTILFKLESYVIILPIIITICVKNLN